MKDLALLVIRIVTGGSLVSHGYPKLFGGEGKTPPQLLTKLYGKNFPQAVANSGPERFSKYLESMNIPNPRIAAYASGAAEFGGGLALLLGFRTRLAALLVLANMAVAIKKVHWETGFTGQGGYERASLVAGGALALFLGGPGAISIDGLFGGVRSTAAAVDGSAEAVSSTAGSAPARV